MPGPQFLSAEQVLLTTLVVKLAVMAALATMLVRYRRFRHILIFERRDWPDRLTFILALGIPLSAGVASRLLLNYNAADLTLEGAFLATGFPFRSRERIDLYLALFRAVFLEARAIRRAGSAALDLACVAAGVFDGFFEFRLAPWDIAAGAILIEEAGGELTDFDGGQRYWERGNIVAGAPPVASGIRSIAAAILSEGEI